ncbi:ABC transporter ATP-binding protein [Streptomyces sp. GMY02]|uniref:ABC transporter ATP-binding protein n=1 Tax=Streptomyces sp. GMY02 TaxID=1333528 RepID=UPI001C2BE3A9|nr:ABC transporter ATP-binding protein [Streptomyces sp. GMY02]QXE37084.1 ABC transporter ATP-binding protein [Streptomyces sp. GMY02]
MTYRESSAPAVSFDGVSKAFGAVLAVDGVGLGIPRGETVALLGRNGAGKSTAIALLLGLDEPDAGTVRLFGGPPARAVAAGRVGAMLQDGRPIRRVTVRELVTFVASAFPRPLPVAEALALAGLTDLADRRVDKLSGGQTQRVRFAVALAGGPELVVLDEPTAALDVEARRAFWASMRAYADRGNTVLFSTHYLEEADSYADRIVVLDHGRIVADGTSELIKGTVGGHLVSFDLASAAGLRTDDTEYANDAEYTEGIKDSGEDLPIRAEDLPLLPGVVSAEVRGGRALLRTDDSDATVLALARLGAVRRLEVVPATLEDAFLALTREEVAR